MCDRRVTHMCQDYKGKPKNIPQRTQNTNSKETCTPLFTAVLYTIRHENNLNIPKQMSQWGGEGERESMCVYVCN